MSNNDQQEARAPVFIVGVPRSGTTLLAAFLSAHSQMICGTETDFFHFLAQVDTRSLLTPEDWPEKALDFLFSLVPGKNRRSVPHEYNLDRAAVRSYLSDRQPSVAAILESVTAQFMMEHGKSRWVEKTPLHILRLDAIRESFPNSPIVKIIRDPRDVALSILKTPWDWAPRTFEGCLALWRELESASEAFFAEDKNTYSLKYEDLLANPAEVLSELCDYLGEEFEEGMLNTGNSYSNLNSLNEPWKEKVAQAPDRSRAQVWERSLGKEQKVLADCLIGDLLLRHAYSSDSAALRPAEVFPATAYLYYPRVGQLLIDKGVRLWKTSEQETIEHFFLVGDPERDAWLGHSTFDRIGQTISLIKSIIAHKSRGVSLHWPRPAEGLLKGRLNVLIQILLSPISDCQDAGQRIDTAMMWKTNIYGSPKIRFSDDPRQPPGS